jgi:hypothetical protein
MELYNIRRNILLNSDIKSINNLYLVDKLLLQIINVFWVDKFNHDGLNLFRNDINKFKEWIKEYNYMKNIQNDVYLILTTNIIETEVYKNVIDENGELMDNKIRIMCDVDDVEDIMSNIYNFKFKLPREMRTDIKMYDAIGHIKISLIDNEYAICYSIINNYDREKYIDLCCINGCKYEQIRYLLMKSLYKNVEIRDFMMTDYLFDGGDDYESNSKIISDVINIEKNNELLELENSSSSKTILLINNIENELHQMQIKNNGNIFTFENIKHINLISELTQLLPIDFSTIIYETIDKINSSYLYSNISIIAYTKYSVKCNIRVYLDDKISYKIKMKQQYDHHIVNDILTKSINLGFKILDNDQHDIYCDFLFYDNNTLDTESVISLNRTMMRRAIEYLL